MQIVVKWFYENYMVLNLGKCQLVCLGNDIFLWQYLIKKSKEMKVLGIIIDSKRKFRVYQKNYVRELSKRYLFLHV